MISSIRYLNLRFQGNHFDSNFFTSELLSQGHTDNLADQVSDSILDAILEHDPTVRIAA